MCMDAFPSNGFFLVLQEDYDMETDFKDRGSIVTPFWGSDFFDPVSQDQNDILGLGGLAFSNPKTKQVIVSANREGSPALLFDLERRYFLKMFFPCSVEVFFPPSEDLHKVWIRHFCGLLDNAVLCVEKGEFFLCPFKIDGQDGELRVDYLDEGERKYICSRPPVHLQRYPRCKGSTVLCLEEGGGIIFAKISSCSIRRETRYFKSMLDACFHPKSEDKFLVCSRADIDSAYPILVHEGFDTENVLFSLDAGHASFVAAEGETIVMAVLRSDEGRTYHQIYHPGLADSIELFSHGSVFNHESSYSVELVSPDGKLVLGTASDSEDEVSTFLIRLGGQEPEYLRLNTPGWRIEYLYSVDNSGKIFASATCIDQENKKFFRLNVPVFIEIN